MRSCEMEMEDMFKIRHWNGCKVGWMYVQFRYKQPLYIHTIAYASGDLIFRSLGYKFMGRCSAIGTGLVRKVVGGSYVIRTKIETK
jgi:hypothetical protein